MTTTIRRTLAGLAAVAIVLIAGGRIEQQRPAHPARHHDVTSLREPLNLIAATDDP